ncbi:DNA-directed RNA polymerase subunit L [Candidatus Micrarchaeota archaeon]|nr:DNA-directed RNA polymerase subunit L [Candidatus Micrarchaeota archaeon]
MNLKIIAQEENYVELELEGEEQGFANALRELLILDKNVTFAAALQPHPQVASPHIFVRTKSGSPIAAIKDASKKLRKMAGDFKEELKSAKKPSESKKKK